MEKHYHPQTSLILVSEQLSLLRQCYDCFHFLVFVLYLLQETGFHCECLFSPKIKQRYWKIKTKFNTCRNSYEKRKQEICSQQMSFLEYQNLSLVSNFFTYTCLKLPYSEHIFFYFACIYAWSYPVIALHTIQNHRRSFFIPKQC